MFICKVKLHDIQQSCKARPQPDVAIHCQPLADLYRKNIQHYIKILLDCKFVHFTQYIYNEQLDGIVVSVAAFGAAVSSNPDRGTTTVRVLICRLDTSGRWHPWDELLRIYRVTVKE